MMGNIIHDDDEQGQRAGERCMGCGWSMKEEG